jgi:hypothetical protein
VVDSRSGLGSGRRATLRDLPAGRPSPPADADVLERIPSRPGRPRPVRGQAVTVLGAVRWSARVIKRAITRRWRRDQERAFALGSVPGRSAGGGPIQISHARQRRSPAGSGASRDRVWIRRDLRRVQGARPRAGSLADADRLCGIGPQRIPGWQHDRGHPQRGHPAEQRGAGQRRHIRRRAAGEGTVASAVIEPRAGRLSL